MIINPSALYHKEGLLLGHTTWKFVTKQHDMKSYGMNVACTCQVPPLGKFQADTPITADMMCTMVHMRVERFCNRASKVREEVYLMTGACTVCGTVFWGCNSFEWVGWLSDLEQVQTILEATPIQHYRNDGTDVTVVKIHAGTRLLFDSKGRLERARECT